MRRSSIFALLAVSVVAACQQQEELTPSRGRVLIRLLCLPTSGLEFKLLPWRVVAAEDSSFTWEMLPGGNVDQAVIGPGKTTFPFQERSFIVTPATPARAKPAPGTLRGTYKYTVTAVCSRDGGKVQDTAVIDPDMFVPW
ncbi:MAG TPA: hypothetical protein VES88_13540 [Gemmatimonadaceae bacterium]|nr:hypothetical protein [Gemmatimonadaceae bacterium]